MGNAFSVPSWPTISCIRISVTIIFFAASNTSSGFGSYYIDFRPAFAPVRRRWELEGVL